VVAVAVAVAAGVNACGGSSGPTPVATPTPVGPAPSPTPTPTPTATPTPVAAECPLGKGTASASCARHGGRFVDDVDAAVSQVLSQRPTLFDLGDPNNPRVRDTAGYYAEVLRNLRAAGFCANYDGAEVQVKNTNEFSEQYDVLLSDGAVRRGAGAYRLTCQPASFPLDPEDVIDSIRVAFYGIRCADGRTPPNNALGKLPIGCSGFVTATPKNRENRDVPPAVHGPNITWVLKDGGQFIDLHDDPDQTFNKTLVGRGKGHFTLCATLKGVEGCLHGEVID
jgi:hypothetical protein